jgi:hypothetical protein
MTYFDPMTAARIDGHDAMEDYDRRRVEINPLPLLVHPSRRVPEPVG